MTLYRTSKKIVMACRTFFQFLRGCEFFHHTKLTIAQAIQIYVISNFEEDVTILAITA